jgi:hypothetical protein
MQNPTEKYKQQNIEILNKFLKVNEILALNPNGFGDAKEEYLKLQTYYNDLKTEILDRMNLIVDNS